MDEKERSICNICCIVGTVVLLMYIILTIIGINPYLLVIRLILAGIAAIIFAIKLGIEILSKESCINSVFLIANCLGYILIVAMQL